jgi:hypothetical protein
MALRVKVEEKVEDVTSSDAGTIDDSENGLLAIN